MTDTVVSIRMPSYLVVELKRLAETNHFKDLSEEIRSIVRTKCLQFEQPYTSELQRLREDLSVQNHKRRLIDDLKKIVEELQNEK